MKEARAALCQAGLPDLNPAALAVTLPGSGLPASSWRSLCTPTPRPPSEAWSHRLLLVPRGREGVSGGRFWARVRFWAGKFGSWALPLLRSPWVLVGGEGWASAASRVGSGPEP